MVASIRIAPLLERMGVGELVVLRRVTVCKIVVMGRVGLILVGNMLADVIGIVCKLLRPSGV